MKEELTPRQKQMRFREDVRLLFECTICGIVLFLICYGFTLLGGQV